MSTFKDLPKWILNSNVIQSILNESDETDEHGIDIKRIFDITNYINNSNIKKIIENILYFDIHDDILDQRLFDYFIQHKISIKDINSIHRDIVELPFYNDIQHIRGNIYPYSDQMFLEGISRGLHFYVEHAVKNNNYVELKEMTNIAARHGQLECLKILYDNNLAFDEQTCEYAAHYGNFECLKYAHEHGCELTEKTVIASIIYDDFNCFEYIIENQQFKPLNIMGKACEIGNPKVIKLLFDKNYFYVSEEDDEDEDGEHINEFVSDMLISGGHVECLKYLHDEHNDQTRFGLHFCPNIETIKYLRSIGIQWDDFTLNFYISGYRMISKPVDEYDILEKIKYACENGCPTNDFEIYDLARVGLLECLKYVTEHNIRSDLKRDILTCGMAVSSGNYDCLKYAHEQGYSYHKSMLNEQNMSLLCLRYITDNFNFDRNNLNVCKYAAMSGNLEVLTYAHENGYPWGEEVLIFASKNGHIDCLKYAKDNQCPEYEKY